MRIKEVSQITGLTEKTIRFYEEKQLIHPGQTEINGRIFRSYTKHDIDQLNLIACLRKLDFSISDIATMQNDPERIPGILNSYRKKNAVDLEFKTRVMERLKQIEYGSVSSVRDLGEYLKEIAQDRSLPEADVKLQFYKIDGLTKEEMDREVQDYYERQSMKDKRETRRKITGTAVLYIASVVLILIIGLLTWRNIYYLGYIPSYRDNLGWKWILIPQFGLLIGAVSYIFIKTMRNISYKEWISPDARLAWFSHYCINSAVQPFNRCLCFNPGLQKPGAG
ncbi:MAG: MerR family transcriptional regulator [Clostridiaceae bacterium]|nr:MerR family transcriptional regulator [Clostridiaceae bacterium]